MRFFFTNDIETLTQKKMERDSDVYIRRNPQYNAELDEDEERDIFLSQDENEYDILHDFGPRHMRNRFPQEEDQIRMNEIIFKSVEKTKMKTIYRSHCNSRGLDCDKNSIELLNEHALINKVPTAKFELLYTDGPPHTPVFTVKCIYFDICNIGRGKTFKNAKHQAADAIFRELLHMDV